MSIQSPKSPVSLISYAHADGHESVDVLAQELRLRGIRVVRDIQSFRAGRALDGEMRDATDADLVVGHLGPAALESTAVMKQELGPALHGHLRHERPVVVLVPHGIGADRAEVDATIAGRLPYSHQATWALAPEPTGTPLTATFAANAARASLASLYGVGRGLADGRWSILLLTRGIPRHGDGLVIDATELVGGATRRPGCASNWTRIKAAIGDLALTLGRHGSRRAITLTSNAHSTAGVLAGHAFNRAAGWDLNVISPAGTSTPSGRRALDGISEVSIDGPPDDRRLFVGIDLAGRGVAAAIDDLCAIEGGRPGHELLYERTDAATDMTAAQMADAAAAIGTAIKSAVDGYHPERIDLFIAAPAPVAVLLGSELATLGLPIVLWEHRDSHYVHAVDVRHGA
ncbi:MAG: SAVED domain-containing protein [Solirubrobacteraceae bacterium]